MQPEKSEVNSILMVLLKQNLTAVIAKTESLYAACSLWISTCKIMTHLNAQVTKIFLKHAKAF